MSDTIAAREGGAVTVYFAGPETPIGIEVHGTPDRHALGYTVQTVARVILTRDEAQRVAAEIIARAGVPEGYREV